MLETEAVLGRMRPSDLHTVFRSIRSRSRRHEPFDVFERQTERPHRRRVGPRIVHVPEAVLAWTRSYRFHLYRAEEAERVGGPPAVDTAWVVVEIADQCRQSIGGTRSGVHCGDRTPRFRVVVRHACWWWRSRSTLGCCSCGQKWNWNRETTMSMTRHGAA